MGILKAWLYKINTFFGRLFPTDSEIAMKRRDTGSRATNDPVEAGQSRPPEVRTIVVLNHMFGSGFLINSLEHTEGVFRVTVMAGPFRILSRDFAEEVEAREFHGRLEDGFYQLGDLMQKNAAFAEFVRAFAG
jgi:hypothetical protein